MANPYDNLPLPSADEYPYNLQGDQSKARALADAAKMGSGSALEKLKSLGLDNSGGLKAASPDIDRSQLPLAQQQFEEANRDDERNFAENQRRFNQQTAMAKQRMQFEQEMTKKKMDLAEKQANEAKQKPSSGGGGGSPQGKTTTKTPQPKSGGGGGGGGRGGGSKSAQTPEAKAREQGRFENAKNKADRRNDAREERRDNEALAKEQGYSGARAMEDAKARDKFFEESRNKREGQGEGQKPLTGVSGPGAPKYDPKTGAPLDSMGNPTTGYDKDGKPINSDGTRPPKMTHAYGNKHAGMVRARGDLG
jgi:hypothetical protein